MSFDGVQLSIPITYGNIFVSATGLVPEDLPPITRAIVRLSPGIDKGMVNTILIIDSEGELELSNQEQRIEVYDGTDLVQKLGQGPIRLKPGLTNYTAQGSDFGRDSKGMLTIELES
jgi:hypothetical protein